MTTEVYTAAEQAGLAAFGTLRDSADLGRLRDAFTAYRNVLAAAGILAAPTMTLDDAHAELAARLLAEKSGHVRYSDDGWRTLLVSEGDVDLAYDRALERLGRGEDTLAADLSYARRILHAKIARTAAGGGDQP